MILSDQECRDIYNATMEGDRNIISVTRAIESAVIDKLGKQKPVGWLYDCHHKDSWGGVSREFSKFKLESTGRSNWKPLYAAPVVQQQEESQELIYECVVRWDEGGGKRSRRELARRIASLFRTSIADRAVMQQALEAMRYFANEAGDATTALGKMDAAITALEQALRTSSGEAA